MAEYKVRCAAFVTVFRKRTFVVHASSEKEAMEKARDKFADVDRAAGWDVDSVETDVVREAW